MNILGIFIGCPFLFQLYQFTQSRFVNRKDVTTTTKIPTEEMKDILEKLAVFSPHTGWEFALPYDHAFVKKY